MKLEPERFRLFTERASRRFPPVEMACDDGLLLIGGRLTVDWLLDAYSHGVFPWPFVDVDLEVLAWYSPDPRAIIELDRFHISRRLRRRLNGNEFRVTIDTAFSAVVAECAAPREPGGGTWITHSLANAFGRLHRLGIAHSVEVWSGCELVGGVYGVALGGFFAAESMFHRRRDASKVALAHLIARLRQRRFSLFDIQQSSPHLASLGATEIPRGEFIRRLANAMRTETHFADSASKSC